MHPDLPDLHDDHIVDHALLERAIELLDQTRLRTGDPVPPAEALDLPAALPADGIGPAAALETLAPIALNESAQLHHPGYFAHMDPPTPAVVWAASLWQTATNQNLLHPDAAPSARPLTERVIEWIAPFFGMDGGHFVSGSSAANLTALWVARNLRGVRRVVASDRSHLSVRKAADILGLRYEPVPTDGGHRILLDQLPDLDDAALVLTAGTVATGSIDPLGGPAAAWVHVDAAWAGPLRLTDRYGRLLEGIERADSVNLSAHKWLYQPKGSALVMFRRVAEAQETISYGGGYLAEPNIGLAGTSAAAALPLAATLLAWGQRGLAARVDADMGKAARLASLVNAHHGFELWGEPQTGIVVWRPRQADPVSVRASLAQAWVSITTIDAEPWFRSVAANPSASPDWVFGRVSAAASS